MTHALLMVMRVIMNAKQKSPSALDKIFFKDRLGTGHAI
jgi:hypothetical protein